ncbi:MAG: carbohydrate kinase family protein [Candidatus Blackburnbacteria bacterium]|nr:carbohydrate kinase family protein [Candidatus Blackburnbacteria bacterium]
MENQLDLISVGDSTIDIFMQVEQKDTESVCGLKGEERLICFAYGGKIPVSTYKRIPASGNAANNAIGSSRLGLKTALYAVLGSDQDSNDTKKVFVDEGVDIAHVTIDPDVGSNLSVVLNYSGERTIFVYHQPRQYELPSNLPNSKWMYLTSVGSEHQRLHDQVLEFIKRSKTKLAFNPGSYQLRDGINLLQPVLSLANVLILNREEAVVLVGGSSGEDVKQLIVELKSRCPGCVVITDGAYGSYASYDGREIWHAGISTSAPIVEKTGAGDAYSTGFVAALIQGKTLPEAMLWGTMNSTSVAGHIGAREGLLTPMKMEEFIKMYGGEIKPRMV